MKTNLNHFSEGIPMQVDSEFIDVVRAMRAAQKGFFATKSREALQLSKRLERRLDQYLNNIGSNDLFADRGISGGDGEE